MAMQLQNLLLKSGTTSFLSKRKEILKFNATILLVIVFITIGIVFYTYHNSKNIDELESLIDMYKDSSLIHLREAGKYRLLYEQSNDSAMFHKNISDSIYNSALSLSNTNHIKIKYEKVYRSIYNATPNEFDSILASQLKEISQNNSN